MRRQAKCVRRKDREIVGEQKAADNDKEDPADGAHNRYQMFELVKIVEKAIEGQGAQEERYSQAERVGPSIRIPVLAVLAVLAYSKMDPRIGPTHGVQPAAKVTPTINAPR